MTTPCCGNGDCFQDNASGMFKCACSGAFAGNICELKKDDFNKA